MTGQNINLIALGVNNAWIDPQLQYQSHIDYALNNTYNQIISPSQASSYRSAYASKCAPALAKCTGLTGNDAACSKAQNVCSNTIEGPISQAKDFDVYDVRQPSNDPFPPSTYATYLNSASVRTAIGAQSTYQQCPDGPFQKFSSTGDNSRSFLSTLGKVVSSGIRVVVWAGDADWICNYIGNFNVVNVIPWSNQSAFAGLSLKNYTVGGKASGLFKTLGNLSWLQVYEAGHEVMYYQPAVSLQVFKQTMSKAPLSST